MESVRQALPYPHLTRSNLSSDYRGGIIFGRGGRLEGWRSWRVKFSWSASPDACSFFKSLTFAGIVDNRAFQRVTRPNLGIE